MTDQKRHGVTRRDAIRNTLAFLGAVSAPALVNALATPAFASDDLSDLKSVLSKKQRLFVAEVSEMILPATDTPGAKEAGVPEMIDHLVAVWLREEERAPFLKQLDDLNARCHGKFARDFVDCSDAHRAMFLKQVDKEAYSGGDRFFRDFKEMVLFCYYTSEVGATLELRYEAVPGRYIGCMPVTAETRTWAT